MTFEHQAAFFMTVVILHVIVKALDSNGLKFGDGIRLSMSQCLLVDKS